MAKKKKGETITVAAAQKALADLEKATMRVTEAMLDLGEVKQEFDSDIEPHIDWGGMAMAQEYRQVERGVDDLDLEAVTTFFDFIHSARLRLRGHLIITE